MESFRGNDGRVGVWIEALIESLREILKPAVSRAIPLSPCGPRPVNRDS